MNSIGDICVDMQGRYHVKGRISGKSPIHMSGSAIDPIWAGSPYNIEDAINKRNFGAIPADRKSKSFYDENPWPPPQFMPVDENNKFCTWCGHMVELWIADPIEPDQMMEYVHTCERYGKHCRHEDLSEDTFYLRVTSFGGSRGRHHFDDSFSREQFMRIDHYEHNKYVAGDDAVIKMWLWKTMPKAPVPVTVRSYDTDDEDDCTCECDGCGGEDRHCGDDLVGCHEMAYGTESYSDYL